MIKFKKIVLELSLKDRAEDIAQIVHSGQNRRSSGAPYIIHPVRVQLLAKRFGLGNDEQLIAILHDTYEDSNNKSLVIANINNKFGNEIAKNVIALSHEQGTDYTNYVYELSKKYPKAFNVKLLDMYDNLIDNPSSSQKIKYSETLLFLINHGVRINNGIKNDLMKIIGRK
jgi:(p)ppGpp synthase/HD superfamily hydrolase